MIIIHQLLERYLFILGLNPGYESFLPSYFDLRGVKCNAGVEVDLYEKECID